MSNISGGGPGTPPGWYPDNEGASRWWDGSRWTEHTQQQGQPGGFQGQPGGYPPGGSSAAPGTNPGAKTPWYKKKWVWAAAAVLLIIGIASGGGGEDDTDPAASDSTSEESNEKPGKNKKAQDDPAEEEPAEEAAPDAMPVQAGVLLKDFEDNEAAADGKYNGKTLRISGVVSKVDTEVWDDSEYVVQIGSGGNFEFLTVNCDDQSADDVSSLSKGDDITVVADFEDGGDLGVELKDCSIV